MNTNPEIAAVMQEMREFERNGFTYEPEVGAQVAAWRSRLESAKGEVQGVGLSEGEIGALNWLEKWHEDELPPYGKIKIVCAALRRLDKGEVQGAAATVSSESACAEASPHNTGESPRLITGLSVETGSHDGSPSLSTPPESGAVAWRVIISGMWAYFDSREHAQAARDDFVSDWTEAEKAECEYRPEPLYAHPSPGVAGVSDEMVERAARAMASSESHLTPDTVVLNFDNQPAPYWKSWEKPARAALTAALSAKESNRAINKRGPLTDSHGPIATTSPRWATNPPAPSTEESPK